jgi:gamma-glutamyltranspeptidase
MPAMVFQDHRPWLVLGTTGGASQPQLQAELVTQLLDFGCDVQASIDAPRWAVELGSDGRSPALVLEMGVPGDVVDELRGMGHEVERQPDWDAGLGHGYVIRIDWMAGVLEGGADPRGDGLALGY